MNKSLKPIFRQIFESNKSLSVSETLTMMSLCLLPLFHLTFNHWTGICLAVGTFFAIASLILNKELFSKIQLKEITPLLIALTAYPLVVVISQFFRWSFTYKAYLDIAPFLYFVPIAIVMMANKVDFGKWLQISLPITILGSLWAVNFNHPDLALTHWGARLTVYFSDPLAFGQMMMTLALMCLSTIQFKFKSKSDIFLDILSLCGSMIGLYLSIKSGSRTGWLAIPIVLFLIFIIRLNWGFKKSIPLGILFTLLSCAVLYFASSFAQERILLAINEITSYPWGGGIAPETSVGLRITFQRLGWYYFTQSPIWGWGNQGYLAIKDVAPLIDFSTQFARDFVYSALFHNELMTQMVRYGILGIIGYCGAVLLPLRISLKHLRSSNQIVARSALMSSIFIICQIVVGFSDEFLNLKGMVAFYAFIIVTLHSTVLNFSNPKKSLNLSD